MGRTTLKKNKLWPPKYYRGLTRKQALERKKEIKKFGSLDWRDPLAYTGFKTDTYRKTKRRSSYTVDWNNLFPEAKSLKERSNVTGVPVKYLQTVYNRGMAAWRTGTVHRSQNKHGPILVSAPSYFAEKHIMGLIRIKYVWPKRNRLGRENGFDDARQPS